MFEELDDPQPFLPDEAFRTAVIRGARSSTRRRTALRIGGVTCAAAVALPAAFAFYEYHRLDSVHRISIPAVGDGHPEPVGTEPAIIGTPSNTAASAPSATIDPTTSIAAGLPSTLAPVAPVVLTAAKTFLVVGVDSNPTAGISGARSDTMMLLRIDPDSRTIRLLSIPRDLWIHAGGSTKGQRINSLLDGDDPQDLVVEIEQLLAVSVDHYVQVDFDGFTALTDLAGGVGVTSDVALRDSHTGLDLPAGTCVRLDGTQALALVRSRHTQFFDGSTWKEDPRSDFGRIERQQVFLRSLASGLLGHLDGPSSLDDLISIATKSMIVDQGFGPSEMLSTAWTVRSIGMQGVESATIQATGAVIDGNAVLQSSEDQIADATTFIHGGDPASTVPTSTSTASTSTAAAHPTSPDLEPCEP